MRSGWETLVIAKIAILLLAAGATSAEPLTYHQDGTVSYSELSALQSRAEAGDADAQYELYNFYGDKQDYTLAYEWLEKAADQWQKSATFWSFMRYDNGGNFSYHQQKIDYQKSFPSLETDGSFGTLFCMV